MMTDTMPPQKPGPADALLIIDVQNDFLPGGALAVPDGNAILPALQHLVRLPFGMIVTSQDWHPSQHISFQPQGPWVPHCVARTEGAALAAGLSLPATAQAVFKGTLPEQDSYSAFGGADEHGTPLATLLQRHSITRVFLCGLALDYCVKATALDARANGLQTLVLMDACRGIAPDQTETLQTLRAAGVLLRTSQQLDG
ncbi:nicotinamidase [Acetobacter farinalis]|uniref:nicotinamidase n=1 Tax=Acetobacter farinalis TaxID=1260984 RepID=A0ABT3Q6U6_9PROT|nr:nicotinamidase [Acetobacter farinalis]MCX2561008.1 nicotinamidase [Acetobacter farinalis]NHO29742.1 isochorismatase family protein [Acetobacter farinalis]